MNKIKTVLRKPILLATALLVAGGIWLPSFASAFGQISSRSIELSSSTADASNVTYNVGFTESGAGVAKGITVDFCAESPLYQSTCTLPAGFSATGATLSTQTGTSGWTLSNAGTGHFQISGATANSAAAMSFEVTGIHNPTATGSFYARIYVYAGTPDYTSTANAGTVLDFGGIAMSTTRNITITARVMETLSMCVSRDDLSNGNFPVSTAAADCASSNPPDIEIGHGTTTKVIDNTAVDMTPAYFQLSTNAINGAVVRMKATNTCPSGGITTDPTGADCSKIPGVNGINTAASLVALAPNGPAGFGLYVNASQLTNGSATSAGVITPSPSYNDGSDPTVAKKFAMDTSTTGVTSTYGGEIASTSGAVNAVVSQLYFGATASLTTPAGIYTGGENLIATGTF